jgi:cyclophilin family peptidyl-prolyl cis-trans isomerase
MTSISTWSLPAALTGVALLLAACGGAGDGTADVVKPNPVTTAPTTNCSAAGVAASNASTASATVCMLTSAGEIVVELHADKAPATVANFLKYVADGFYANTIFHRVPKDFVVQGGGFVTGSVAKTATYAPITLESNNGLSNLRGTLAMARASAPNSATSQFYFNTVDNIALDYKASVAGANGYAVFGKVISGQATLDRINVEPRWTRNAEVPATEVLLYWTKRLK